MSEAQAVRAVRDVLGGVVVGRERRSPCPTCVPGRLCPACWAERQQIVADRLAGDRQLELGDGQ